jgi:hypothetical protein
VNVPPLCLRITVVFALDFSINSLSSLDFAGKALLSFAFFVRPLVAPSFFAALSLLKHLTKNTINCAIITFMQTINGVNLILSFF